MDLKQMREEPHADILTQLHLLEISPDQPLVISDADEVLLRFVERLELFLARQDLWIDLSHAAIKGAVKSRTTNEPVEVPNLIDDFFANETRHIEPTDGAAHALERLSQQAQVLVLTNLPASEKQARIDNLAAHGMRYPVVIGSGLKGPTVAWLHEKMRAPVFFLDDISHNINSVAEHAPDVHRIHFVADPRLAKIIDTAKGASARIDVWSEAYDWIANRITTNRITT